MQMTGSNPYTSSTRIMGYLSSRFANNKSAEHTVRTHSLISTFVFHLLESIMPILDMSEISIFCITEGCLESYFVGQPVDM